MSSQEPLRIELTPEQRAAIHRASGREFAAIELAPEVDDDGESESRLGTSSDPHIKEHSPLLRWRLSLASGIPRQAWMSDEDPPPPTSANA